MGVREWLKPPRHLVVMFFGLTAISAAALGWLSWQLVRQDRDLAQQQSHEGRSTAAHLAAAALQKDLSELEERLTSLANLPEKDLFTSAAEFSNGMPEDSILVILHPGGLEAFPPDHLLYYPVLPQVGDIPVATFAEADALESRERNYPRAIEVLTDLARSPQPRIRAEALARLGRNLRLAERPKQAVAAYEELAQFNDIPVSPGRPADLVARGVLIGLLEPDVKAKSAALAFYADLNQGHWRLERPVYQAYVDEVRERLGSDVPANVPSASAMALAEAVYELWEKWGSEKSLNGRQTSWGQGQSALLVERSSTERTIALVAGPHFIASNWLSEVKMDLKNYNLALTDAAGHPVFGNLTPGYVPLLGSETELPWNIYAMTAENPASASPFSMRTRLVIGGVAAIALLVLGGSYLIGRAVARELAVARQQSDFVSAVSHEFRTPLTALRQLSELLVHDRVPNDDLRRQYYKVLEQESGRLHRLVEGLLKFGRIEAGAAKYQFGAIDTNGFLTSLVGEFSREAERHGCRVELSVDEAVPPARADREALSCVVWNLLDNAVKYSPDCQTVWVDSARENGGVAIRVRDKGVGIPREEQKRIFQKFVRGETAKTLAIPGTGIGLAVARQIMLRHGGEIRLDSEPGSGSTFTVVLPSAGGLS